MKKTVSILLLSFITLGLFAQSNNQIPEKEKHKIIFGNIYAGLSIPVLGDRYWNRDWEPNYMFAGSIYTKVCKRLIVGVRLEYSHWIEDQYALTGDYPSNFVLSDVSAGVNIIAISPVARYIILNEYGKSNLFLQMGIGYYNIKGSYNFSGAYLDNTGTAIYVNPVNSWNYSKAGISLGCGIKAGFVEILPLYNIVFTSQSYTQYFTINLGIDF